MAGLVDALAPTDTALSTILAPCTEASGMLQQFVQNTTQGLVNLLVVRPLAQLYLDGPTALGFWGGRPMQDICAHLTHTDASFWLASDRNVQECQAHVERHFNSWVLLVGTAGYFSVAAAIAYAALCRCRRRSSTQVIYLQNNHPPPVKK